MGSLGEEAANIHSASISVPIVPNANGTHNPGGTRLRALELTTTMTIETIAVAMIIVGSDDVL